MYRLCALFLFLVLAVSGCDCGRTRGSTGDGGDNSSTDDGGDDRDHSPNDGGQALQTTCDGGTVYTLAELRNVAPANQCITVNDVLVAAVWEPTDGGSPKSQFWVVDPSDSKQGIFVDKLATDYDLTYAPRRGDRVTIHGFLKKIHEDIDEIGYRTALGNLAYSDGGSRHMIVTLNGTGTVPSDAVAGSDFSHDGGFHSNPQYLSTRINIPASTVIANTQPPALARFDGGTVVGYDGFELSDGILVNTVRTDGQCPYRAAAEHGTVRFPSGVRGLWDTYTQAVGGPGSIPGSDAGYANVLYALSCNDLNATVDSLICPSATNVSAGTAAALSVVPSFVGESVVGYQWGIASGPDAGIGTPNQWLPDPPNAITEHFLPYIIGDYQLHVSAYGSSGGVATCDTTVRSLPHGLRVELTWDGPGDLDLHLHSPDAGLPWFDANEDCFYGNCIFGIANSAQVGAEVGAGTAEKIYAMRLAELDAAALDGASSQGTADGPSTLPGSPPIWDPSAPPGQGGNPHLDFDNTVAFGPENTNIDTPIIGDPYTVAVHNYANAAGRLATIKIYCGNLSTNPAAVFVSRAFTGTSAGSCTSNDFWKVATVTFTSQAACQVNVINTYTQSSQRCLTF